MSHYVPLRKRTGMSRSLLKKKKRRGSPGACRLGVLIPREESNAMNRLITSTAIPARELKIEALASMSASFERLCLAAGLEALGAMMEVDAQTACGPRHGRGKDRTAHRWGKTKGKIGFHGGKVEIARPRLRSFDGKEQALPSCKGAMTEDWLGQWAMNQMLINVSTRKFERSMRLPEGDVPAPNGSGLSKSAASRRFVALSAARLKEWMGSDLSDLGLLVIQIDGIHMDEDMTLVAAIGVDERRQASARAGRGRHGKRGDRAGVDRQSRRARPQSHRAAPLHHRRLEGSFQGDPGDVWARRGHSALSDT